MGMGSKVLTPLFCKNPDPLKGPSAEDPEDTLLEVLV
jgi:hypothetical protein